MGNGLDFTVRSIGEAKVSSPVQWSTTVGDAIANYVDDEASIIHRVDVSAAENPVCFDSSDLLQKAGPRRLIYFNPRQVHAGIVTCGGLCPGINDVIRAIVRCLWYSYGVRRISGIQFGYNGLLPEATWPYLTLDPAAVDDIHKMGGSCLGTSRGGGQRTSEIVDSLERSNLNILFAIGGDGTQKGALAISEEILRRGLKISVIGVPKTIDNDLSFIQKSFGFETAVSIAAGTVTAAHTEAHSAINGIGLVKLMGRDAGFIAAYTALASHEANFVLIPEVPFELDGRNGLLHHLSERIKRRNHAVIVVAEGAGRDLVESAGVDASGNELHGDIGLFLRSRIEEHFASTGMRATLKYIDPSYIIRSAVAAPTDSVYCSRLGNNAVHAALAGKTSMLISMVNDSYVHVPMEIAVGVRNSIDPESSLWRDVVEATQQPARMLNE